MLLSSLQNPARKLQRSLTPSDLCQTCWCRYGQQSAVAMTPDSNGKGQCALKLMCCTGSGLATGDVQVPVQVCALRTGCLMATYSRKWWLGSEQWLVHPVSPVSLEVQCSVFPQSFNLSQGSNACIFLDVCMLHCLQRGWLTQCGHRRRRMAGFEKHQAVWTGYCAPVALGVAPAWLSQASLPLSSEFHYQCY